MIYEKYIEVLSVSENLVFVFLSGLNSSLKKNLHRRSHSFNDETVMNLQRNEQKNSWFLFVCVKKELNHWLQNLRKARYR